MANSISNRVKRIFFWTFSLSVLLVLLVAWWFLEDLEATTLEMDKQAEIEHFLNRHETDKVVRIQSATLTLVYLPANSPQVHDLPIIFQGLPIPFEGEMEFLNNEYLVIINQIPEGTYYLAKDLSLFEHRESLMVTVLLVMGSVVVLLSLILSVFISRMISRPLQQLTEDIHNVSARDEQTRLPVSYKDAELNEISASFNRYLQDIEGLIKRERSLVTMASHELRTPIAVILGATEILERRQRLHQDDRKTLQRIISSTETMSENVQALLALVRQTHSAPKREPFPLGPLVTEVMEELATLDPTAQQRIQLLSASTNTTLTADRTMVRILLHNLIGNALNHNQGSVAVSYAEHFLEIRDEGLKHPSAPANNLKVTDSKSSVGLGLYIVTLVCDYLGWQFSLESNEDEGTCVRVHIPTTTQPLAEMTT